MLDATTASESEIESRIDVIEKILLKKQQDLFKSNQPSLFAFNYTKKSNWDISKSIINYYKIELRNLQNYIAINFGIFFLHLLLIIGLILLFVYLQKKHITASKNDLGLLYKKRLLVILSRPVSVALIVGLFLSLVIYPTPPLVFNDLMRLLVVFPIVLVLIGILERRYHIYVYAFGAIIIFQIIYINLPGNNLIGRYLLLLTALIEAGAFLHFARFFKRQNHTPGNITRIILTVVYVHFAMALVSIIGNILGKIQLSEFLESTIAGNALAVTIIVLSLIVVNGFVVLFLESRYASKANVISQNTGLIIDKITRFFNFAAVVLLVYFFLRIIGWETKFIDSILEWFGAQRNLGSIEFNWGEIVIFFLVIWLSVYVSNIVRSVLEEDILNKMKLEKGLPHTISMMARYTLITIGIFLAVSAAGIPFSDFAIIFGAFGVGIGFGLQNIFNNLVSGLILLFERPIKIGDTIEVGQLMGNVRSIGIRSSNVRTFDGAEIIVPNGNLISNEVINWTLSDQTRRIEVIVGVSYSSDPHKVQEILLNVLSSHKEIVQNPEPNVYFRDLGESSLDFRMLCWTERFDQWVRIKSEIIFMVFDALKEANIEIPFPQRDLHVRSVNPNIKLSNEGAKKQE
jgi:small-conductance mechanosensitive channel